MICKFFKGGTKSGSSHINYLTNERVENGTAKVIVGNSELTKNIIKNIENKYKFSSGVMSFEETNISKKYKDEIIQKFRDTFFCGLDENQYNLLVVEHSDKNRTELHFVIPRIELKTGKAINPFFVKRDFKKKDLFQDFINAKYNLTSPHEEQKQEATKTTQKKDIKAKFDEIIVEKVNQGIIKNADDIKRFFEEAGAKVNRQGKEYIGIEIDGKKLRLKGAVYGKNFTSDRQLKEQQQIRERTHIRAAAAIEKELDQIIGKQSSYNKKRYQIIDNRHSDSNGIIASNIRSERLQNNTTQATKQQPIQQTITISKQTVKENTDDITRAAAARRAREQREDEYRAYQEAREARIKLYKAITRDIRQQQEVKRGFIGKIRGFGEKIFTKIGEFIDKSWNSLVKDNEIRAFKAKIRALSSLEIQNTKDELLKQNDPLYEEKRAILREEFVSKAKSEQETKKKDTLTRADLRSDTLKLKKRRFERER